MSCFALLFDVVGSMEDFHLMDWLQYTGLLPSIPSDWAVLSFKISGLWSEWQNRGQVSLMLLSKILNHSSFCITRRVDKIPSRLLYSFFSFYPRDLDYIASDLYFSDFKRGNAKANDSTILSLYRQPTLLDQTDEMLQTQLYVLVAHGTGRFDFSLVSVSTSGYIVETLLTCYIRKFSLFQFLKFVCLFMFHWAWFLMSFVGPHIFLTANTCYSNGFEFNSRILRNSISPNSYNRPKQVRVRLTRNPNFLIISLWCVRGGGFDARCR